ncbi:MAG: choice-of-anchor D domain-containing protein, partial [Bacteroidales bacterium]|nr:choice-of-anchor D domain-containing protein [Bacteroidales bacterium]
ASTDILNVEDHQEKLSILSNDPENNPGLFTIDLNITGGGESNIEVNQQSIDFGQVFQGADISQALWLENTGKATTSIYAVTSSIAEYLVEGNVPQEVTPGRRTSYDISLNTTELGDFNGVITVTLADGDPIEVPVSAEVIEAPEIVVDIDYIMETVESGGKVTVPFTVSNTGGNNLDFAPLGNDWLSAAKAVAPSNAVKDYTYEVSSSDDNNGPTYNWQDITATGERVPYDNFYAGYWIETIDLPFEFNFYGEVYNKVYVAPNGMISFTEYEDAFELGGALIPHTSTPNNLIAANWGITGPAIDLFEDAGVYYQSSDDKLVIQYHRVIDGLGSSLPTNLQIILYANGNIKMQFEYEDSDPNRVGLVRYSQTGIENADGSEGVLYSGYEEGRIHDDLAILYAPVEKYTLAPNATLDMIATLDASELYADFYGTYLKVLNNTPGTGYLNIPVQFEVTGEAKAESPSLIDFGTPMVRENLSFWPPFESYTIEFEIKNHGTKSFEVKEFDFSGMTTMLMSYARRFRVEAYVMGGGPSIGPLFGPPGGGDDGQYQWMTIDQFPPYEFMGPAAIVEAKSSLKMRAVYTPDGTMNTDGTSLENLNDELVILTNLADMPEIEITFTATPVLPPVMELGENKLSVYAQDDTHTETKSVVLDNSQGKSELEYSIKMDYERNVKATATSAPMTVSMANAPALMDVQHQPAAAPMSAKADEYNRILKYFDVDMPTKKLGLGGAYRFSAATRFYAPDNGFNLSHVQTWYTPEEWMDSKITVDIMAGSPFISQCEVIYTEDFDYSIEQADYVGEMLTFELANTQVFYPNEPFFVVFTYPTAVNYPQGVIETSEEIEGRFTYSAGDTWYDMTGTNYATDGWMMAAIEAEYKTGLWVVLNGDMEGTVPAGETINLDFDFTAQFAENGDNRASATITSNDPVNNTAKVDLHLLRNRAPEIILTKQQISVIENITETIEIAAIDHEQDDYTLTLSDAPEFVTSETVDGKLLVTIEAGYEAAGVYECVIEAKDVFDNINTMPLSLNVINSNREPVITMAIEAQEIILEYGVVDLNLADYISDPDGEKLSFEYTNADNTVVD